MATFHAETRSGLPRFAGGEPWPAVTQAPERVLRRLTRSSNLEPKHGNSGESTQPSPSIETTTLIDSAVAETQYVAQEIRQGLPRQTGEGAWPSPGIAPRSTQRIDVVQGLAQGVVAGALHDEPKSRIAQAPVPAQVTTGKRANGSKATGKEVTSRAENIEPHTLVAARNRGIMIGAALVIGAIAIIAALVLGSRWLVGTGPVQEFVTQFPGEYHLPENAPVGFPAWLGWQHFFNIFLMVLIIRSGLQFRREVRPKAFWASKRKPTEKISITKWFHQSLDLFWILNGVIFVVLLVVTGQWMRVVPTSIEVFPNALSAGLQYLTLDWPTENGWVNYNSLQQLAYFTTIFIAAPLSAVTGFRLSSFWPNKFGKLGTWFSTDLARKVHFPVMIYFVLFIFIHVALVFSTGALRNLNHMYAAQGSTDPEAYAANWTGFWFFVASMLLIVAAWFAARPTLLANLARINGVVSSK